MKRLAGIIFLILLLSGCSREVPTGPLCRVVTQIQITSLHEGQTLTGIYTDPKEMASILNYQRLLDPYVTADIDPDTFRTDTYEIIVTYSDGAYTTYRQIHESYLQTDGSKWKHIAPEHGIPILPA